MSEEKKKLAVIVPGMGYHKDKPLLYYAAKLAAAKGYERVWVEFHDLPVFDKKNPAVIQKAGETATAQTEEQLASVDFDKYENVLFIGKSIGTATMAKYIADHGITAKQVWYTPVEQTVSFGAKDAVAFIGDADPCSDVPSLIKMMEGMGISVHSYPDCNHSLECEDVDRNLEILRDVMQKTESYISLEGK
ncbi:MAG: alpha/beta hydrolase [Lachnospiraceae bacterium]|nr:alpha/beta hydrolase [Lachnospiraceae bacterium]